MKMQYKIGDHVVVEKSNVPSWNYGGKTGVIVNIDPTYQYPYDVKMDDGSDHSWSTVRGLVHKFKVGDRVIIDDANIGGLKGKNIEGIIESISNNPESEYPYWIVSDYNKSGLYCNVKCLASEFYTEKIVITHNDKTTTATLYKGDGTKKVATARCAPEDTFDFAVGAKLGLERLTEKPKPLYNGKVVCTRVGNNVDLYTLGKIYQFVDGTLTCNNGFILKNYGKPFESFDQFKEYTASDFIEIVE